LSPLYWAIRDGKFSIAQFMLEDLLSIRADREEYYYGKTDLFDTHPDIVEVLCREAPNLVDVSHPQPRRCESPDQTKWHSHVARDSRFVPHTFRACSIHFRSGAIGWLGVALTDSRRGSPSRQLLHRRASLRSKRPQWRRRISAANLCYGPRRTAKHVPTPCHRTDHQHQVAEDEQILPLYARHFRPPGHSPLDRIRRKRPLVRESIRRNALGRFRLCDRDFCSICGDRAGSVALTKGWEILSRRFASAVFAAHGICVLTA